MRTHHRFIGALAALGIVSTVVSAQASSHREAPAISRDPAADNTDLWAWTSTDGTKLWVVAAYNPLEEPSGGPNFQKFSDDVLYEVHIARGDASLADVVDYQIRFSTAPYAHTDPSQQDAGLANVGGGKEFFGQLAGEFAQTYTVTKVVGGASSVVVANVPVVPPNIGPRTNAVAYGIAANSTTAYAAYSTGASFVGLGANSERTWAGPRDDGFYVDLARIFDLADYAGSGPGVVSTPSDGVAGFNCHAIVLEIPTTQLTGTGNAPTAGGTVAATNDAQTLGVWASASRRKVRVLRADGTESGIGPWVQVSRQGLPLINEAVIGLQDKDKYNRTNPANDVPNFGAYFLNPVIVKDADAVGIYAALSINDTTVQSLAYGRLDIINTISLTNIPTANAHAIPLSATGDVIRVDMGFPDAAFPNGRPLFDPGHAANGTSATTEDDVTDIELNLLIAGATSGPAGDGVNANDTSYLGTFPFLGTPWEGATQGHGKTAL